MRSRHKTMAVIVAAAVASAGGIWLYSLWFPRPPEPETAEPEEVRDYLASDRFGKLSEEERAEYLQALRDSGQMPRGRRGRRSADEELTAEEGEQREKIRKNIMPVFRKRHEERLKAYFELPEEERTAYLDEMIDRIQQHRSERRPDNEHAPREQRRRGPSPERMKERIETTDPETRAQSTEFRRALRERMEERGVHRPHTLR